MLLCPHVAALTEVGFRNLQSAGRVNETTNAANVTNGSRAMRPSPEKEMGATSAEHSNAKSYIGPFLEPHQPRRKQDADSRELSCATQSLSNR